MGTRGTALHLLPAGVTAGTEHCPAHTDREAGLLQNVPLALWGPVGDCGSCLWEQLGAVTSTGARLAQSRSARHL